MTTALWVIAVLMILIGIVGTVLPALPGVVLVFAGITLAAWIDSFAMISAWTIGVLAVLALIGFLVDYLSTVLFARRAGATRYGIIGAAIGTVAGIFFGLLGIIIFPLIGAFAGEFLARRDALRAGRIGLSTWVGLLVAAVVKIAIVFTMLGIFIAALIF